MTGKCSVFLPATLLLLSAVTGVLLSTAAAISNDVTSDGGATSQEGRALVKFEGQAPGALHGSQPVTFEGPSAAAQEDYLLTNAIDDTKPLKNPALDQVVFRDDKVKSGQRKRKRRKPRVRRPGIQGQQGLNPYATGPLYPAPGYGFGPYGSPAPAAATGALAAVIGALTSIARYDDYQCVPRLLCEAAGGGALGAPGTSALQSVAALQPLLTVLSAYSGASSSPLFVFGRAVLLGMTSPGGAGGAGVSGACRAAYPQCPNDPEQLVHYLNNHNGGFFRLFSAPNLAGPQDVQQLYNQLSAPGHYGLYQPQPDFNLEHGQVPPFGQHFQDGGQYPQNIAHYPQTQNYGLLPNSPSNQQNSGYGFQGPSLLQQPSYGAVYPYNQNFNRVRYRNSESDSNEIEKRIQNTPESLLDYVGSNDRNPMWIFPQTYSNNDVDKVAGTRKKKTLAFPEKNEDQEFMEDDERFAEQDSSSAQGFRFPGGQSKRQYSDYNGVSVNKNSSDFMNNKNYMNVEMYKSNADDGFELVYVVRGNGDPNHPEIVRVKTGDIVK